MSKQQVRISFDKELYKEAKKLGLDLAKSCELGLRQRIAALRALEGTGDLEPIE